MKKQTKNPCWDGYVQRGMKMKNGKEVPNCIPITNEELGKENEWGTPALTKKMKKATPGQWKEDIETETLQYHETLNPAIWEGTRLNEQVRVALLNVATKFMDTIPDPVFIKDIVLTGSNANYNWTKFSDLDLHIIVDLGKTTDLRTGLKAARLVWNTSHNIKIKGYPVELYVQESQELLVATGVYSLMYHKWLNQPVMTAPSIDHPSVRAKAQGMKKEIDDAVATGAEMPVRMMLDKVSNLRKSGLQDKGEFSTENLVFKILRNSGHIEKLRSALTTITDRILSLEDYIPLQEASPAWQKKEGKSESGGLNKKGIASYRRQNPGSKLSMAVTTEPSKLKKGSKSAKRRLSFCRRMKGMKKKLTSSETAKDPDSRINKSLRKWNC